MTDTDSPIHYDTLNLIERIVMSSIYILIAKHSSRDDSSDRCRLVPHDQILHTRRLSGEDISLSFWPERILHISCWMCLRDIDCIEVEILCCHLHRVIDIESHPYKCILHLSLYECDRMETAMFSQERYCHILLLTRESLGDQVFFDPGTLRFEGVGDDIASLVRGFTYCSSLLWGEILESL